MLMHEWLKRSGIQTKNLVRCPSLCEGPFWYVVCYPTESSTKTLSRIYDVDGQVFCAWVVDMGHFSTLCNQAAWELRREALDNAMAAPNGKKQASKRL